VNLKVLVGAGCLAGIGFTMSLFIAGLAFQGAHLDEAKVGILVGRRSVRRSVFPFVRFLPAQPR